MFEEFLETCEFRKLELLKLYPFISELQDEDLYNGHIKWGQACTHSDKIYKR